MKIAVIGSGNIGGTLAMKLSAKNHQIVLGTRDATKAGVVSLVERGPRIAADTVSNAVKSADVVIVAIPLAAIPDLVREFGDLAGKVLIETTNAFGNPLPGYGSGTEAIKALTGHSDVVKAFNAIGAEDLSDPQFGSVKADTFVAGDSLKAKEVVKELALDLGFETCYDLGGDSALLLLESLAVIWGTLAYKVHLGRRCAFKILHS